MSKRPTLTDQTSLTNSSAITSLNQNWDAIQEAFDNTLSLDGSVPNAMNADLDLNGNALLNVGTIDVTNLTLDGQTVTDLATVPEWRSAWLTATAYTKNDLVKINGNVYICLISHTSGTFSTDLTALKWELMVSKGDSGAGTGDVVAANNLSDLANAATARGNLGLGTVATENTVPISKGGTGAADAATAVTNLGAQPLNSNLTSLGSPTYVRGDIIRRGSSGLERLALGSSGQVLSSNGTDAVWTGLTVGGAALFQTITTTAVPTIETNTFNEDKSYIFEFEGVGHSSGANRALQVEFYGDTDGAYSSVVRCSASITTGNRAYGRGELFIPRVTKKVHSFSTTFADVVTSPGTNFVANNASGAYERGLANWGTAQPVLKLRFSWVASPNFVAGDTIRIWEI